VQSIQTIRDRPMLDAGEEIRLSMQCSDDKLRLHFRMSTADPWQSNSSRLLPLPKPDPNWGDVWAKFSDNQKVNQICDLLVFL
jgi:hypothetical protein